MFFSSSSYLTIIIHNITVSFHSQILSNAAIIIHTAYDRRPADADADADADAGKGRSMHRQCAQKGSGAGWGRIWPGRAP